MENVIQIGKETKQKTINQFHASYPILGKIHELQPSPYPPPGNALMSLGPNILILTLWDGCGMNSFSLRGEPFITPPFYV